MALILWSSLIKFKYIFWKDVFFRPKVCVDVSYDLQTTSLYWCNLLIDSRRIEKRRGTADGITKTPLKSQEGVGGSLGKELAGWLMDLTEFEGLYSERHLLRWTTELYAWTPQIALVSLPLLVTPSASGINRVNLYYPSVTIQYSVFIDFSADATSPRGWERKTRWAVARVLSYNVVPDEISTANPPEVSRAATVIEFSVERRHKRLTPRPFWILWDRIYVYSG